MAVVATLDGGRRVTLHEWLGGDAAAVVDTILQYEDAFVETRTGGWVQVKKIVMVQNAAAERTGLLGDGFLLSLAGFRDYDLELLLRSAGRERDRRVEDGAYDPSYEALKPPAPPEDPFV